MKVAMVTVMISAIAEEVIHMLHAGNEKINKLSRTAINMRKKQSILYSNPYPYVQLTPARSC